MMMTMMIMVMMMMMVMMMIMMMISVAEINASSGYIKNNSKKTSF